ncbi:EVE domain-containing protein [Planktothrix serta]|uniref:EVE domain-containing protein n=1 Tax=Planktothrix serta TaxID=1678310 RepID=UPI0009F8DC3D|nr:EVE domain-containing protein [Planktothrix serta]
MNYWLIKSEPESYSIQDLKRDRTSIWDGVRNYQARNFLKQMQRGDLAFFYHSNTKPPGIVGLAKIIENHQIDPTQFDLNSPYFDPKATPNSPRWHTVKVEFVEQFSALISLDTLKQTFNAEEFGVVKRGNRLSVMPVLPAVAETILRLKSS